jgi:ubiquitin conjugation factor E4 B
VTKTTPAAAESAESTKKEASESETGSAVSTTPQGAQGAQGNPFSQLDLQDGSKPKPQINIKPASGISDESLKRERAKQTPKKVLESTTIEAWEHETLSEIFRISLDPEKKRDYLDHQLTYLHGVRTELEEEEAPLHFTCSLLEQVIIEAASSQGKTRPLDYMLSCWKRISKLFRTQKAKNETERLEIVREARRLCMSYSIFAITTPELFGYDPDESDSLASHLLIDQMDDRGIDHDFLLEFASRFEEDEAAVEAMVGAVEEISSRLGGINMDGDYKPSVDVRLSIFLRRVTDQLGTPKPCTIPSNCECICSFATLPARRSPSRGIGNPNHSRTFFPDLATSAGCFV